ncbi:MAG TPA: hypothetical protein VLJ21_04380 [Candidatus Binatia bacterium]|nr:hypothetical protein [Candidatus Binatia bacterium]
MKAVEFVKEYRFELAVLVLFVLAWSLRANVDGLFLDHPGTVKAADPFYHTLAAQVIVDEGKYGYLPYYLAQGWKNMIDPNPPLNYLATAGLTKVSALPVWDVMYLLVTFFEAFGVIFLYLLCSKMFSSKPIGVLAAALYVIPFGIEQWWYGMYIGLWNNVGGFFFFYASLWLAYEYWQKPSRGAAFALSLTVAGTWLVHIAELFITAFAIGIIGLKLLFLVKPFKEKVMHAIALGTVPLISVMLFYPRYHELSGFLTAGSGGSGSFFGWYAPQLAGLPFYTSLTTFPWWLLVIAAIGLFQILLNWRKYTPLLVGNAYLFAHLFIFPWFLSAYYFFIRQRMALPFIITPLVAYALYHFGVRFASKLTKVHEEIYALIVIVLVIGVAALQYPALAPMKNSQHLTQQKYDALVWLQQNTPPDSEVFFLDGYYQMSDSYAKRVAFDLDFPDFIPVLQGFIASNGTMLPTEFSRTGSAGFTEMVNSAIDNGTFFRYGYTKPRSLVQNITNFDYVVMADFQVGDQPFVQAYNARMIQHLVNDYGWRLAFDQNGIHIVQRGGKRA